MVSSSIAPGIHTHELKQWTQLTLSESSVSLLPKSHGAIRQPKLSLSHQVEVGVERELGWHRVADLLESHGQFKGDGFTGRAHDGQRVLLVHCGDARDELDGEEARVVSDL